MANYLVTGAAGFIGSHVAALLLQAGHEVAGIDNINAAYDVRLKEWRLAQLARHEHFTFHKIDICHLPDLERVVSAGQPFAAIINLAARAGVRYSVENPWVYYDTNVTGTLNLLELCRAHRVPKFVLASSSSVYGQSDRLPYAEADATDRPLSPYAASKKAAEVLCHSYHHLYGLDVTIFRYFTVYGPAGRPDMAPFRFVQWISEGRPVLVYGDGQQSRDFTYVDDIARGTVAGLKPLGYEIINLGSDHPVSVAELIATVEALTGQQARISRAPAHAADTQATWADIGKARALLGWQPAASLAYGMQRLFEWYKANQAWAKDVATL